MPGPRQTLQKAHTVQKRTSVLGTLLLLEFNPVKGREAGPPASPCPHSPSLLGYTTASPGQDPRRMVPLPWPCGFTPKKPGLHSSVALWCGTHPHHLPFPSWQNSTGTLAHTPHVTVQRRVVTWSERKCWVINENKVPEYGLFHSANPFHATTDHLCAA